MPFTVAHVAAALPFRRTRLVMSAVVVGSMAPDFEYFLRLAPHGRFGHTLFGLFTFTLPMGLVVLWLFHRTAKFAIVKLMPTCVQQRLAGGWANFRFGDARRMSLLALSVLAGAVTHIIWDSFTHDRSWPTENWTLLQSTVLIPWLRPYPVELSKVLQHVSTLAGMGVLAIWLIAWFLRTRPLQMSIDSPLSTKSKLGILTLICALALGGAWMRVILVESLFPGPFITVLGVLGVTSITLLWWELVLLGAWWQAHRRAHPNVPAKTCSASWR